MKLSRLYSNRDKEFPEIIFNDGLNVVLARVTKPLDASVDSHCLGKTFLISVIDFCLLKQVDKDHVFKSKIDIFSGFIFYIELKTNSGLYVTVRRAVSGKIALLVHRESKKYSYLPDKQWDQTGLGLTKAVDQLNQILSLNVISQHGYSYRAGLRYCLRSQHDYGSVFRVKSFNEKDRGWKPYLAQLLGVDSQLLLAKYNAEEAVTGIEKAIDEVSKITNHEQRGELQSEIELLQEKIRVQKEQAESFNFAQIDSEISQEIVSEVDQKISDLNDEVYSIDYRLSEIERSLNAHVDFDLEEVSKLFSQVELHFPSQLEKSYEELCLLNDELTRGRNKRLIEARDQLSSERNQKKDSLVSLNEKRAEYAQILLNKEAFDKYKRLYEKISHDDSKLYELEKRLVQSDTTITLRKKLREAEQAEEIAREELANSADANEVKKHANITFSHYLKRILNVDFKLSINVIGSTKNIEFSAKPTNDSNLDQGYSYSRVLAAAFDVTLLSMYHKNSFFRFAYHDGLLESLDDRKKLNLIGLWRELCEKNSLQLIFTTIEDDLPIIDGRKMDFPEQELVLELNDSGDDGRLFKMPTF